MVTLGTKNFTEQLVLGQLYAQALQAKGFKINLKTNLGPTEVVQGKLRHHQIDGYPEYTGTVLSVLAHDPHRPSSAAQAYARAATFARHRGERLLAMASAEDTDVVITKPAYAAQHHLDPAKTWIALLPGSRWKEIRANLPTLHELAMSDLIATASARARMRAESDAIRYVAVSHAMSSSPYPDSG